MGKAGVRRFVAGEHVKLLESSEESIIVWPIPDLFSASQDSSNFEIGFLACVDKDSTKILLPQPFGESPNAFDLCWLSDFGLFLGLFSC